MGFTPESTTFNLKFSGTELDGLKVKIGCCTVGEFDSMVAPISEDDEVSVKNKETYQLVLKYLESWNLEIPAGQPVPLTEEGFKCLPTRVLRMIISAWHVAMADVPDPLGRRSSDGGNSEESQLGMADVSRSLGDWPEQN